MKLIFYVLIYFVISLVECLEEIDPFDMNTPRFKSQRTNIVKYTEHEHDTTTEHQCMCLQNSAHYSQFYKRTIHLILNSISLETASYDGHIHINILQDDYRFLREFAEGKADDADTLNKVDFLLSKIFLKPIKENVREFIVSWTDSIYFTFYNRSTAVLFFSAVVLWITYRLLKANFTLKYVIMYLVFIGWICDFAFTWINLLQEKEIEYRADALRYKSIPVYCDPNKMSWWQYLWNEISTRNECREYHRTMFHDYFYAIAPFTVFSHQFGNVVVIPASYIGKALGLLTSGIMEKLPFGISLILLPLIYLFTAVILCILCSFLTKTRLAINVFHLFKLEFGDKQQATLSSSVRKELETYRLMVEDLRMNRSKEIKDKQKNKQNKSELEEQESDESTKERNGSGDTSDLKSKISNESARDCDGCGDAHSQKSKTK